MWKLYEIFKVLKVQKKNSFRGNYEEIRYSAEAKCSDMEDFSFERLRSSQSSRREKTIQKTSKARVKLFLIFFRKSGKILHSKQYVNHLIDWAVNGHSVGSSWIYSLFLSSNMYWWRTIYSWVVCFFTPECGLTLPSFLLCLLKIIKKEN